MRPKVAVVASPVARIFAELATPGRRVFFAVVRDVVIAGGVGRSGSFIISHHLRLRSGRRRRHRRALRNGHGRHRRHRRRRIGAVVGLEAECR